MREVRAICIELLDKRRVPLLAFYRFHLKVPSRPMIRNDRQVVHPRVRIFCLEVNIIYAALSGGDRETRDLNCRCKNLKRDSFVVCRPAGTLLDGISSEVL